MPEAPKVNLFQEDWRPVVAKVMKAAGVKTEGGAYRGNIIAQSRWLAERLGAEYPGKRLKELSAEQLEAFVQKAAQWGKDNGKFAAKT